MVPRREAPRSPLGSSLPPLSGAVSSLSGLTRQKERRLSAHGERPKALAEATAAAAAAEDREHLAQAAATTAGAILAAASPGGERGRD